MILTKFSVTNYRSITQKSDISLKELTVLTVKNNEGKSNLLKALNVAMNSMIEYGQINRYFRASRLYQWDKDFPVQLQGRTSGNETIFKLEFILDKEEQNTFYKKFKIRCNEQVPIVIRLGKNGRAKINVPKRGSKAFQEMSSEITAFICERISVTYIPAVRTEHIAMNTLRDAISYEVRALEYNDNYKNAVQTINDLQQEILDSISIKMLNPLKEFIPQLQSVKIVGGRRHISGRYDTYSNQFEVLLDDGVETNISDKGDGIKSLATLAVLKNSKNEQGASIIVIEEPESHLHPSAIHELVNVIHELTADHQVIISTHNPLFVQRNDISSNIIVNLGSAKPAKSIKEIRDVLGVLPADNLINASHVLVVEGDDDRIALKKLLSNMSSTLKFALQKNTLVIQTLAGASNLNYNLNLLRSMFCNYFVYLDHDDAGRSAGQKALDGGYITEAYIKYAICNGQSDSEFEDCLSPAIYSQRIKDDFGVDIKADNAFRCTKKWSDRLKDCFQNQGQRWTDVIEKKVKLAVAECISDNPDDALIPQKRSSIDALVTALENFISNAV
jgi:predicted ATPase